MDADRWVPETSVLSGLNYGRAVDSKGLMGGSICTNWPIVPEIVPGIPCRSFASSFGDRVTDNTSSNFPL